MASAMLKAPSSAYCRPGARVQPRRVGGVAARWTTNVVAPPKVTAAAARRGAAEEATTDVKPSPLDKARAALGSLGRRAAAAVGAAVCAAALLAAPGPAGSAEVIRLPASEDPSILVAQQTMVQAWTIVGDSFFDAAKLAAAHWTDELRSHMLAAYFCADAPTAYREIASMLSDLGDPYTRLMPPEEYRDFMVASDGRLQGVGLLIANEPGPTGHLLVLGPIKGSPADRAGILPGDILTQINGEDTAGWTGEEAAKHLRGQGGTEVKVRLVHNTDLIPGVAGRPPALAEPVREVEVSLTRETVALVPLTYAALPAEPGGGRLGYLKLMAFSQNAGEAVREAVHDLQAEGVDRFVLDLRSNPGGLVQAAADVARVFLDGNPTLFTISGRAGEQLQEVTLEGGAPETSAPLAVLVDHGSASASEILSGALRDHHRAVVIGDEKTYGKGRIQSVFEMDDGSGLFVTVARYRTPSGADIDLRGIRPDLTCTPPIIGAARPSGVAAAPAPAAAWQGDAEEEAELEADRCLLTAMDVLADPTALVEATAGSTVAAMP